MKAAKRRVTLMWASYWPQDENGDDDFENSTCVAVMWSSPWNRQYWSRTIPYRRYRDHDKQERDAARKYKKSRNKSK